MRSQQQRGQGRWKRGRSPPIAVSGCLLGRLEHSGSVPRPSCGCSSSTAIPLGTVCSKLGRRRRSGYCCDLGLEGCSEESSNSGFLTSISPVCRAWRWERDGGRKGRRSESRLGFSCPIPRGLGLNPKPAGRREEGKGATKWAAMDDKHQDFRHSGMVPPPWQEGMRWNDV